MKLICLYNVRTYIFGKHTKYCTFVINHYGGVPIDRTKEIVGSPTENVVFLF